MQSNLPFSTCNFLLQSGRWFNFRLHTEISKRGRVPEYCMLDHFSKKSNMFKFYYLELRHTVIPFSKAVFNGINTWPVETTLWKGMKNRYGPTTYSVTCPFVSQKQLKAGKKNIIQRIQYFQKMRKGRTKAVGCTLEKYTPEQTHPGTEATTGTNEYKHSTLKANP